MSTVKRISSGNYTITANSVIQNTLATIVTSTSGALDINSSIHIYIPSPISTAGDATLANGSPGQTVVISNYATNTWTVNVTSAGWTSYGGTSTTGNVIFNNPRTSVTLRWTPEVYGWTPVATAGTVTITT
jgi:hypothetical protein